MFSLKPDFPVPISSINEVILNPTDFQDPSPSPLHIQNKWFVNLSSKHIPQEVQGLLQLGENFSLPTMNTDTITVEFIKCVENNIGKLPANIRHTIRNRTNPIINNLSNYTFKNSPLEREIISASLASKNFIHDNPDVIFTRADKGNVTVALDKTDYMYKMNALLNDNNTYSKVNKDPTKKLIRNLHEMLARWKKRDYVTDSIYKRLNCTDGVLPRAYGVPKIHKPGCPLRIIVLSENSPLYEITTFLHNAINNSIPTANSRIDNSFQLVEKLKNNHFPDNHKLLSLDVVSLFTNVPTDLALESVTKRWSSIEEKCTIPRDEFLSAVRFVLDSTYFTFDNVCYQQTFGTPMGSPLSPVIADITLQDLETRAFEILPVNLPFFYRYVDDIVLAAPSSMCNNILHI
ncbi:reverse transcriptase [Lasius niger]|uniref:Reverse transcriptase n=1 Tax=Lasius niger TaxID=67767 RepID=A0A0J7KCD0_LASNI|nr:reverse transcriptase [Lasius niger]